MARNPKVIAIANPHSGKHTPRAGLGTAIAKIMTSPRWIYNTETLDELRGAATHIHAARPELVVVTGGDGSLNANLNAIIREYDKTPHAPLPSIVLFPTGTENVVGNVLHLTGSPEELKAHAATLRAKIEANAPLDTAHLHSMLVNGEAGFLAGSGLPVTMLQELYAHAHLGPRRRVIKVITQAFWKELRALALFRKSPEALTRPVHATITLPDGHEPPYSPYMTHTAIIAGTVDQIGRGCKGLYDARSKPGHLMLRSTNLGFWGLLRRSGQIAAGFPASHIFDAVVPHAEIDYKHEVEYTLDGELRKCTTQRISCGPLVTFVTG